MNRLSVSFRSIDDTRAAIGWAGVKCIVADRPKGVAGGLGLGLSGGELQALALGAGFCNQLQFSAEALGLTITRLSVQVELELENLVTGATIRVDVDVASGEKDVTRLMQHAKMESTISNSVAKGFPVKVEHSTAKG
jgi:organic hydroperoxide reductase OsmC/OhrA